MEFIGKWKVLKTMSFTEDGVKHLTKEEIIAQDGEDADIQMFDAIIEFTEDGAVKTLVPVPADQIEEAKAAGLTLPPYNQFLSELEEVIPAINANGYYSTKSKSYVYFDEATGEEKQWLSLYEQLQYNNLFGKKQRNEILFPILKKDDSES